MQNADPDFIDFVKRLVVILPEERMTVQEAVEHPFITKRGALPPVDIAVINTGDVFESELVYIWIIILYL